MRYLIVLSMLMVVGCNKPAVRDAGVYKQELDFIDAAAKETVESGKAVLKQKCKCISPVEGVDVFETVECDKLASTVLVIESRMQYHTDFMRFLGGISDERPEKDPPAVPAVGTLCVKEGD